MFGLGAVELGIILAIVVVLFGAKRLPEIGAGIGGFFTSLRRGITDAEETKRELERPIERKRLDE